MMHPYVILKKKEELEVRLSFRSDFCSQGIYFTLLQFAFGLFADLAVEFRSNR